MKEVWAWSWGKNGRLELWSSRDEAKPALVICLQDMEVLVDSQSNKHRAMGKAHKSQPTCGSGTQCGTPLFILENGAV
ncbi:hypothetical protein AMTR_s00169p00024760 [Amborella trichopoda]|uniref:Uncharacterized protein n=1 Tax=Amborella trichopoda TaxID=13333 RepID=W1PJF1_AMBTC|nr:hypothetical protein AMTR_s00169p00024760 [Amborella trichopoda]